MAYFTIPDRRRIPRETPERRKDHERRQLIDSMIAELRSTQLGLMLYMQLRPEDHRAQALLDRCDAEIMYYAQQDRTEATTERIEA